jgi:arginyl-tRNA synthetase
VNLRSLQTILRSTVTDTAREKYDIELTTLAAENPPRTELGDLAFPVAFDLARRIKQSTNAKTNPRAIAEELRAALLDVEGVARVEVAGAGFLNVFFDRALLLCAGSGDVENNAVVDSSSPKFTVEHTSINPNKAAHIGHLRNAVLGDTFVRVLRATGVRVEVQNYIDNTGVQVADVVVGFQHIERMTLDDVRALDASLAHEHPFDYYCWDLYARVGGFYREGGTDGKENPERIKLRAETLHAIETGGNATAQLADYIAMRVVAQHLKTMSRLGIRYDVLPRESEILHLRFWDTAFERLKETGAIRFETVGKLAGCWVLPSVAGESTEDHEADKIIVRSNGSVTYAGKDIAYQLWKLGRLGRDFFYKPFHTEDDGREVWVTTGDESEARNTERNFGAGARVFNVIDLRQSYTQDVVKRAVAAVAPDVADDASVHLAYEMVALSPAACAELGIALSDEDKARPYIEMSGRKGLGVKGDELINRLEANALAEVAARNTEMTADEQRRIAHIIAVGALRYFLLKWTRNSVIAFDFTEALSLKGETGPYCQYAATRANSVIRKLDTPALDSATALLRAGETDAEVRARIAEVLSGANGDALWSLWSLAARLPIVLDEAARTLEPAHLAKYAFELAREFSGFYQDRNNRILDEPDETRRAVLIAIASFTRTQLTAALATLGIEVPERM